MQRSNLLIKVCGITDTRNAREIAALGVDYLGFIFVASSPRFVGAARRSCTHGDIGCKTIGVFCDPELLLLRDIVLENSLDAIQLHGDESPSYCEAVKELFPHKTIIKAFGVSDDFDFEKLNQYTPSTDFFLFDTSSLQRGGTGQKFNWSVLARYRGTKGFFIAGGISPDDSYELTKISSELPMLVGVDINSRFESLPGVKEVSLVAPFVEEIRNYGG